MARGRKNKEYLNLTIENELLDELDNDLYIDYQIDTDKEEEISITGDKWDLVDDMEEFDV